MRPYAERRLKAFSINPECLTNYLRRYDDWPARLTFAKVDHDELPTDAVLLEVTLDIARRSLAALYTHPSFPEVPVGMEVPYANGGFGRLELVMLERQDDGSYRPRTMGHGVTIKHSGDVADRINATSQTQDAWGGKADPIGDLQSATKLAQENCGRIVPEESSADWFRRVMSASE